MTPDTAPTHTSSRHTRTLIWTLASVLAFVLFVLLLSTVDDDKGRPWIETSLLGQLITTLGAVIALFGPVLLKNAKDVAVVKHEVKNDHKTNLRVENDERHAETKKWFDEIRKDIGGIRSELRDDRRHVNEALNEHSERIRRVERSRR